jgi:hypothetical protein
MQKVKSKKNPGKKNKIYIQTINLKTWNVKSMLNTVKKNQCVY